MGLFTNVFASKLRMELAEIKHAHALEIDTINAKLLRDKSLWEEDKARLTKKLTEDSEIKLKEVVTLTKLDSEQRIKQAELNADRKFNEKAEALNKDYYDKMTTAMSKLHEEGNVTTRFTQDLALKMMGNMPANKSETKVLTGTVDIHSDPK